MLAVNGIGQLALISIHAPREGSDGLKVVSRIVTNHFYPRSPRGERRDVRHFFASIDHISIHAPREGSDPSSLLNSRDSTIFLSTLPARGATKAKRLRPIKNKFLSTLPARGATIAGFIRFCLHEISIHAPREGSDSRGPSLTSPLEVFLSTLPARGATKEA